jgi:hypothetical protein
MALPEAVRPLPSYVFISFGIVSSFINCTTPSSGMAGWSFRSEVNEPTVNLDLSHISCDIPRVEITTGYTWP